MTLYSATIRDHISTKASIQAFDVIALRILLAKQNLRITFANTIHTIAILTNNALAFVLPVLAITPLVLTVTLAFVAIFGRHTRGVVLAIIVQAGVAYWRLTQIARELLRALTRIAIQLGVTRATIATRIIQLIAVVYNLAAVLVSEAERAVDALIIGRIRRGDTHARSTRLVKVTKVN